MSWRKARGWRRSRVSPRYRRGLRRGIKRILPGGRPCGPQSKTGLRAWPRRDRKREREREMERTEGEVELEAGGGEGLGGVEGEVDEGEEEGESGRERKRKTERENEKGGQGEGGGGGRGTGEMSQSFRLHTPRRRQTGSVPLAAWQHPGPLQGPLGRGCLRHAATSDAALRLNCSKTRRPGSFHLAHDSKESQGGCRVNALEVLLTAAQPGPICVASCCCKSGPSAFSRTVPARCSYRTSLAGSSDRFERANLNRAGLDNGCSRRGESASG